MRKTVSETFFASVFIIHFYGGTDAQRDEIMHKIFRFLDSHPSDWQFSLFDYFEYLFVARGCKAFNWFVATKNLHARRVYEKFVKKYFGHLVGKRHCGQMAYNGEVSDIILYEATCEEYFEWKEKSGK